MNLQSRPHWMAFSVLIPLFAVAGSASAATKPGKPAAVADLINAKGEKIGTADFYPAPQGGARMVVEVHGLTPGKKGIHIHENGSCVAPDFKSAGGHLNPDKKHHGLMNPEGHHAGDMPNLRVAENGTAKQEFNLKGIELTGSNPHSLFKPGGAAVVIHADADDEKTDPAGNAGPKIACGVIRKL